MTRPKILKYITENRITVIAVLVFVSALLCVVAFTGNKSESEDVPEVQCADTDDENLFVEETDNLSDCSEYGYGLVVDDSFIAALDSKSDIDDVLDTVLDAKTEALGLEKSDSASFSNDVEIAYGEYPASTFTDETGLIKMLGMRSNNTLSEYVTDYSGSLCSVTLSVVTVETVEEDVLLVHSTKKIYTDALRDGTTKVVTAGVDGESVETYDIVRVDGNVVEKVLVKTDVISEKVDAVVKVGTKAADKVTASLGLLSKPYDGIISSYYGTRWGRLHAGLDIVASGRSCKGDPALAAGNGTVIFAEYNGGYGNCVIIDHGDGIETLYAHLGDITVAVGDNVSTGDMIGHIGTTGSSTGYHLHFEVHVDGETVNPLLFVDYE